MPTNSLNDSLDDLLGGPAAPAAQPRPEPADEASIRIRTMHTETCPKCRGTGRFVSWAGRDCGPCFACQGRGSRQFRNDAMTRSANREAARVRRMQSAIRAGDEAVATFKAAHPDAYAWLERHAGSFDFARDLLAKLRRYGELTENQLAAVLRGIERDAARDTARAAETAPAAPQAPQVAPYAADCTRLFAAFQAASASGLRNPQFIVRDMRVKLAGPSSRNPGALYVFVDRVFVGMVKSSDPMTFIPSRHFRALDAVQQENVVDQLCQIAENPVEAARLHGRQTGNCSCCGRLLTDPVSVANGIGPICAGRWGFSF